MQKIIMYLLSLFATLAVSQVPAATTSWTTSTRTVTLPAKTTTITVYPASLSTWTGAYTATFTPNASPSITPTTTPISAPISPLISSSTSTETHTSASLHDTKTTLPTSRSPSAPKTNSSICINSTNSILYDCITNTSLASKSSIVTVSPSTHSTTTQNQVVTASVTPPATTPASTTTSENPANGGYAGAEVSYLNSGGHREGSRAVWCVAAAIIAILWDRYGRKR